VLEEVLRMVLEILNSCLSHQLVYCPNLVYTLLYKRHVFEVFRSHHAFQDIIQNIDMVCRINDYQLILGSFESSCIFFFPRLSASSLPGYNVCKINAANWVLMKFSRLYQKVQVNGPATD
jgi:hypothetical protein